MTDSRRSPSNIPGERRRPVAFDQIATSGDGLSRGLALGEFPPRGVIVGFTGATTMTPARDRSRFAARISATESRDLAGLKQVLKSREVVSAAGWWRAASLSWAVPALALAANGLRVTEAHNRQTWAESL